MSILPLPYSSGDHFHRNEVVGQGKAGKKSGGSFGCHIEKVIIMRGGNAIASESGNMPYEK